MRVSLIIPAYNEAKNIGTVLNLANKALEEGLVHEALVIDDGSRDNTEQVVKDYDLKVIRHKKNLGKGAAIQTGIENTNSEIILMLDADLLNINLGHIKRLIDPLNNPKTVMTLGKFTKSGLFAELGNACTSISGQRAFRREWTKDLPDLTNLRFGVDYLMTRYAKRTKLKVKVVALPGVSQKFAEQKMGIVGGIKKRIKMYVEIFKVILFVR